MVTRCIKLLIFFSFLFICCFGAIAQEQRKGFDRSQVQELRGDAAYQYELVKPEPEGFFERLWSRFLGWVQGLFSSKGTQSALDIFFKLLFAVAFVYFLVKALGADVSGLFQSTKKELSLDYDVDEEAIHEINFEKEIDQALAAQNYRLVVRLYYLHALKQASEAQWVSLMQGKTNYEYLYELKGRPIEAEFKRLSYLFDYTWYGHFDATEELVNKSKDLFHLILAKRKGGQNG